MGTKRTAIWKLITSRQWYVFYQKDSGDMPDVIGKGQGSIKDMALMAAKLKVMYNAYLEALRTAAVEGGELHTLEEIKEALDVALEELK